MPYSEKIYITDLLSEENVKKYVLPYYNLQYGNITGIKFKDTDKQRAVYKIDYFDKSYCIKKVYFSREELLFVYSAIEWLYRHDINVPRILPTKDRQRYVIYKDMYFILTKWIDGHKCDYDNIQNIFDSSSNLAKMHKVSESFVPINGSYIRTGFEDIYISVQKHFEQLLGCSNNAFKYGDKFSKIFLENFQNNMELAENSAKVSYTIEGNNLSKSLCHLDYVNKNIIFDNSNNLWVIDFDKCKMDYCAHDIGYFLRRILKRNATKWNFELTVNILDCYDKIKPLSFDEYKYILAYLSFPQKFWKISKDYYNNIKKCNANSFIMLLKNAAENDEEHLHFANDFKLYIEDKFGKIIL